MEKLLTPFAAKLNEQIRNEHPYAIRMISDFGKRQYFPRDGIIAQSQEAKKAKINATIGCALDEDGDALTLPILAERIKLPKKDAFLYAPSSGFPDIRQYWRTAMIEKNPTLQGKLISLPVVTQALTHGLYVAARLFCEPGDTIILPNYYWENYHLLFTVGCKIKLKTFNMFQGEGLDLESFQKTLHSCRAKKIVILLNFPNNPTGYTPTLEEVQRIVRILKEIAEKKDIVVLVDDAYFGFVYEPNIYRESIFGLLADLHERLLAVKLDGPTKEDYVWGWRIGFITVGIKGGTSKLYEAIEDKIIGAIRGSISNVTAPGQSLLLQAYRHPDYREQKERNYQLLASRYRKVREILKKHPEYLDVFYPLPFNSGYFMCLQLKHIQDAEEVRKVLLSQFSTGIISQGNLLRVAYSSTPTHLLEDLFQNIYQAVCMVKNPNR